MAHHGTASHVEHLRTAAVVIRHDVLSLCPSQCVAAPM